jgi:hypothetical protein
MKAQDKSERQRRPLSDRQWDKIERASGLPSEARSSIESDIRAYLTLQEGGPRVPPAKTRNKLRKLRSQAEELLKSFEEAAGHDDVYLALVPVRSNEWHPRNLGQREHLEEHYRTDKAKADLKALVHWVEQRERALSRRKPGPPAERADNVYLFVDLFDNALRHYTKKRLTRSEQHRKMMEEIFSIVDREVGKGTIDTAIRRVCAATESWRGKALPGSRC